LAIEDPPRPPKSDNTVLIKLAKPPVNDALKPVPRPKGILETLKSFYFQPIPISLMQSYAIRTAILEK
jgi:hypothetical protein